MVHVKKNTRQGKWLVTLIEMGFTEAQAEKVLPGCTSLEQAVQRLCGERDEEEEEEEEEGGGGGDGELEVDADEGRLTTPAVAAAPAAAEVVLSLGGTAAAPPAAPLAPLVAEAIGGPGQAADSAAVAGGQPEVVNGFWWEEAKKRWKTLPDQNVPRPSVTVGGTSTGPHKRDRSDTSAGKGRRRIRSKRPESLQARSIKKRRMSCMPRVVRLSGTPGRQQRHAITPAKRSSIRQMSDDESPRNPTPYRLRLTPYRFATRAVGASASAPMASAAGSGTSAAVGSGASSSTAQVSRAASSDDVVMLAPSTPPQERARTAPIAVPSSPKSPSLAPASPVPGDGSDVGADRAGSAGKEGAAPSASSGDDGATAVQTKSPAGRKSASRMPPTPLRGKTSRRDSVASCVSDDSDIFSAQWVAFREWGALAPR